MKLDGVTVNGHALDVSVPGNGPGVARGTNHLPTACVSCRAPIPPGEGRLGPWRSGVLVDGAGVAYVCPRCYQRP